MPLAFAQNLIRAQDYGKALITRQGLALSWAFLDMQDDPRPVSDIAAIYRSQFARLAVPYQSEAHLEESISHMGSPMYAAAYTTYLWSQVIAKDLFTRFDPKDLFEEKVARQYRTKILEAGGSKPAAELVQDFLGRPFNDDAYKRWLLK
jgi:thimet oligopeptidase